MKNTLRIHDIRETEKHLVNGKKLLFFRATVVYHTDQSRLDYNILIQADGVEQNSFYYDYELLTTDEGLEFYKKQQAPSFVHDTGLFGGSAQLNQSLTITS